MPLAISGSRLRFHSAPAIPVDLSLLYPDLYEMLPSVETLMSGLGLCACLTTCFGAPFDRGSIGFVCLQEGSFGIFMR